MEDAGVGDRLMSCRHFFDTLYPYIFAYRKPKCTAASPTIFELFPSAVCRPIHTFGLNSDVGREGCGGSFITIKLIRLEVFSNG